MRLPSLGLGPQDSKCTNCQRELPRGATYCSSCGGRSTVIGLGIKDKWLSLTEWKKVVLGLILFPAVIVFFILVVTLTVPVLMGLALFLIAQFPRFLLGYFLDEWPK